MKKGIIIVLVLISMSCDLNNSILHSCVHCYTMQKTENNQIEFAELYLRNTKN